MRYDDIANVDFTDIDGRTYQIKDFRAIPKYNKLLEIKYNNEDFDEIASRQNIYGEGSENQAFAIFEANIEKLTENNFDGSLITKIIIPEVQ